ncbi:MAG: substrate-binding domain-containing protein [Anaerolineales bacterium]
MRYPLLFLSVLTLLLPGCSSAAPTPAPISLTVQYTASAQAWLPSLVACAGNMTINAEQRLGEVLDPNADLAIRIGQPGDLTSPAFRIGTEDVLVIVNPQNPIHQLSAGQVRGLFSGQVQTWKDLAGADSPVEIWAYPEGDDVQQVFEQAVLAGSPISTTARLANSPEEMAQAVAKDVEAVGFLTRHWKKGDVAEVFVAVSAPVLVITSSSPKGNRAALLDCLQK